MAFQMKFKFFLSRALQAEKVAWSHRFAFPTRRSRWVIIDGGSRRALMGSIFGTFRLPTTKLFLLLHLFQLKSTATLGLFMTLFARTQGRWIASQGSHCRHYLEDGSLWVYSRSLTKQLSCMLRTRILWHWLKRNIRFSASLQHKRLSRLSMPRNNYLWKLR